MNYAGNSKVFGVSIKDRGAIAMAGYAGKAFWFLKAFGQFVTNSYYYHEYPEWVQRWNDRGPTHDFVGKQWNLLQDRDTCLFADRDDQP